MKSEYDAEADAVYIYIKDGIADGEVKRVLSVKSTTVVLDFGQSGDLLGIEILDASKVVPSLAHGS